MRKEEEEDALAGLKGLETFVASDSEDESWGDKKEDEVIYEWQDFFDQQCAAKRNAPDGSLFDV